MRVWRGLENILPLQLLRIFVFIEQFFSQWKGIELISGQSVHPRRALSGIQTLNMKALESIVIPL